MQTYRYRLNHFIQYHWAKITPISICLWPLSLLYSALIFIRYNLYRHNILHAYHAKIPIVVVGNITVGGTGKSPLTIWLANRLAQSNYKPAIISRGYGANHQLPLFVTPDHCASLVGDEAAMMRGRTDCPIVICKKRSRAVQAIEARGDCNIIISDDGLQHYPLAHDIGIICIDAQRLFGNRLCLPAGPLRESLHRLKTVDFVVCKGDSDAFKHSFELAADKLIALDDVKKTTTLKSLQGVTVHAVAGIGNPALFFNLLREHGLHIIEHPFVDHHHFVQSDFMFDTQHPIIMTEKDAVKCGHLGLKNAWYLSVNLQWQNEDFYRALEQSLKKIRLAD